MKDGELNSSIVVRDASAAKLLVSPETITLLERIGPNAVTAKQAADLAGLPIKPVWYRLRRLEACGILKRAGAVERAGRPQPLYRMAAMRFVVPAELRHATLGEQLSLNLRAALDRADATLGEEFLWSGDRFKVRKLHDPEITHPPVLELWLRTALDSAQAARLIAEVEALFDRYRREPGPGEQVYLVSVAAAPVTRD